MFIGIKIKFKSIDDHMRTIPFEWLGSYLVTETRVEFIIAACSVPVLILLEPGVNFPLFFFFFF